MPVCTIKKAMLQVRCAHNRAQSNENKMAESDKKKS